MLTFGEKRTVDPKWIRARVIVRQLFDNDDDNEWPDYFLTVPRVGEKLRTQRGRTLDVLDVVHTMANDNPEIQIEIGVGGDRVTPMEGGEQTIEVG